MKVIQIREQNTGGLDLGVEKGFLIMSQIQREK